jgi:hypothetical protein
MVGWLVLMFNTTFNNILGAQKQTLKQTTLLADLNQVKQDFVYMSLQQRKLTIM